jgi:hypothetical protein
MADKKINAEHWEDIASSYLLGHSSSKIAANYGVTSQTIRRHLRKVGTLIRCPKDAHTRHTHKNDAFDVITEESAYWIGFLMADGCIWNDCLCIGLQSADRAHLEKLKEFLGTTSPICTAGNNAFQLRIKSPAIVRSLARFGVVPRKSMTCRVSILENNRHFWRGVIDGDGTVGIYGSPYPSALIRMLGGKGIVKQFLRFVEVNFPDITPAKIRPHTNICTLTYGGSSAVRIIKFLYDGDSVALDRKASIAATIVATLPTDRHVTHCPRGHALTPDNVYAYTYSSGKTRACKRCNIERAIARYHRLKAERASSQAVSD